MQENINYYQEKSKGNEVSKRSSSLIHDQLPYFPIIPD